MAPPSESTVRSLLERVAAGNPDAATELFPVVYDELRSIAAGILKDPSGAATLQPTALVHEAFVKLSKSAQVEWRGKAQFASLAARAMRQILVDHVRSKKCDKRSGGKNRVTLQGLLVDESQHVLDLLDLEEALEKLTEKFPRQARAVELRFYANMTREEIGAVLGVTVRTINTDLAFAQAWLLRAMQSNNEPADT